MPDFPEVDPVTRRIVSPAVLAALKAQLEEAGLSGGGGGAPITATEDAEGVTLTLAEGSTITATEDAEGVTLITA